MMKIQQKQKRLPAKYAAIAALLVVAIGGAVVYAITSNNDQSTTKSDRSEVASESLPDTIPDKGDATPSSSDQPLPPQPTENGKSKVSVSFTAANQNNAVVQLRTLLQVVVSDGLCTLTGMSTSGKTVTKTATVQPQATTSTCKGFDIPAAELSNETWKFTVNYENETLEGSGSTSVVVSK